MATEVTFLPPAALAEPPAAIATAPATSATPTSPDPRRLDVRCIWILLLVWVSAPARGAPGRVVADRATAEAGPCVLLAVDNRQGGYYGAYENASRSPRAGRAHGLRSAGGAPPDRRGRVGRAGGGRRPRG